MIYDTDKIKEELAARIDTICDTFLPGGKRMGGYYKCGSIRGGPGDSFIVHLTGEMRGCWCENNPDSGMLKTKGRIFDLWMEVNNIADFRQAKDAAVKWLGMTPNPFYRETARPTAPRAPEKEFARSSYTPIAYDTRQSDYLCEERGLKFETLKSYGVGAEDVWFYETDKKVAAILFPLKDEGGILCGLKYLAVDRIQDADGKMRKVLRAEKGSAFTLFGKESVPTDAKMLVITEGEIDAMTVHELGFAAVSVPVGAKADSPDGRQNSGNKWIDTDWDWLERFDDIRILMDNDEAGHAAALTLCTRLGAQRSAIVRLPAGDKDPNQMVQDGKAAALKKAIEDAYPDPPKKLIRARQLRDDVFNETFGEGEDIKGVELPWPLPFRIRMGEVSVFSGYTKHGKTILLTHLMVDMCHRHGYRCGISSLEMPARKTLRNMVRQLTGFHRPENADGTPDVPLFDRVMDWMDDHVFIYDAVGTAELNDLLDVFAYLAKRFGVKLFIIDSFMRLNVAGDDLDKQKEMMNLLTDFATQYNCHIALVAHSKKPTEKQKAETHVPTEYEINGSAAIANIAHNVLVVWRNVPKEMKLEAFSIIPPEKRDIKAEMEWRSQPDAFLYVRLQREGNGERPMKALWYDMKGSWQFRDAPDKPIIRYIK